MKVAFLIPAIDAMGPNIFTYNLILSLVNRDNFYCEVFHFNRGNPKIKQIRFPVKTTQLSFKERYDFSGFDIIHSTMPIPDLYVAVHGLYKKYKCITSMHCFMEADLYQRKGFCKGFLQMQLWKWALKKIKKTIVSSSAMRMYYEIRMTPKHEFVCIPYGIPELKKGPVDENVVNAILTLKEKYKILCGCGSLIKRKSFFQLIDYLPHNPNAAIVLIGTGPCEIELRNQAKRLNVEDRVLFLGFQKDSYNYYKYIDVYCMTSNSEGFGLAMLEAMCMSTPIICSKLDIYKDYFGSSEVGLFEYGNQKSFDNVADHVLQNLAAYGDSSRLLFEKIFSLENMGTMHYNYYHKVLEKK